MKALDAAICFVSEELLNTRSASEFRNAGPFGLRVAIVCLPVYSMLAYQVQELDKRHVG